MRVAAAATIGSSSSDSAGSGAALGSALLFAGFFWLLGVVSVNP